MVLTPDGQQAYKHAKTVVASTAELQAAITPGKQMAGDFRLGFSTALGDTLLGAPLDALRREFPRLHLSVASDESTGLISRIKKRELDSAVILLPEGYILQTGTPPG